MTARKRWAPCSQGGNRSWMVVNAVEGMLFEDSGSGAGDPGPIGQIPKKGGHRLRPYAGRDGERQETRNRRMRSTIRSQAATPPAPRRRGEVAGRGLGSRSRDPPTRRAARGLQGLRSSTSRRTRYPALRTRRSGRPDPAAASATPMAARSSAMGGCTRTGTGAEHDQGVANCSMSVTMREESRTSFR